MTDVPDVTVVIPAHNRREIMLETLQALEQQTYPRERMEIIVIDDGSEDGTYEAVLEAAKHMVIPVIAREQPDLGASNARNEGIKLAHGRVLLIINDDTIPTPRMIEAHMRIHEDEPAEEIAALGRLAISPKLPESIYAHLHHDTTLDRLPDRHDLGWQYFFTYNLSVKAALLHRYGTFDETLFWHEDVELGLRLARHGMKLLLAYDALGYHYHPMDEARYLRIADRDGSALAQWYNRDHALLPELLTLGLYSRKLGTCAARHMLADMAINRWTWPAWIALARALAGPLPEQSMLVYRKLFQWRKRRAIDAGIEGQGALPPGPPPKAEPLESTTSAV